MNKALCLLISTWEFKENLLFTGQNGENIRWSMPKITNFSKWLHLHFWHLILFKCKGEYLPPQKTSGVRFTCDLHIPPKVQNESKLN